MTAQQIYDLARRVGFPASSARKVVAIAKKESAFNPNAFNGVGRDQSYGLMQINMINALGPERRALWGLATNEQLFDPETNLRAAFSLWNGNDANFDRHWFIGSYDKAKYERALASLPSFDGGGGSGGSDMALKVVGVLVAVILFDIITGG